MWLPAFYSRHRRRHSLGQPWLSVAAFLLKPLRLDRQSETNGPPSHPGRFSLLLAHAIRDRFEMYGVPFGHAEAVGRTLAEWDMPEFLWDDACAVVEGCIADGLDADDTAFELRLWVREEFEAQARMLGGDDGFTVRLVAEPPFAF